MLATVTGGCTMCHGLINICGNTVNVSNANSGNQTLKLARKK
jgi:hypothetical protein